MTTKKEILVVSMTLLVAGLIAAPTASATVTVNFGFECIPESTHPGLECDAWASFPGSHKLPQSGEPPEDEDDEDESGE